jgi:Arc/MetJ-type ribon-helix-helix transcriptional regulator
MSPRKAKTTGHNLFNFRLAPEDATRLQLVVKDLGLSRSEVMRDALRRYLDEREKGAPKAS